MHFFQNSMSNGISFAYALENNDRQWNLLPNHVVHGLELVR